MTSTFTSTAIAALGITALTLTAACASAQGVPQTETYELVAVAGNELPSVIERDGNCQDEVLSGTLTLNTDGTWEMVTQERETCGTDIDNDEEREDGTYTVDGDAFTFMDDDGERDTDRYDPNDIDINELADGTRSGDELRVTLEDGQTVLTFR